MRAIPQRFYKEALYEVSLTFVLGITDLLSQTTDYSGVSVYFLVVRTSPNNTAW